MIGQTFGGVYKLYDKVGTGGFATVYLGRNLRSNQIVAVKVLKEECADDPRLVERFRREAKLIQGLDHPNIVRVLDYGIEAGQHFLVMDYVEGKTLAQLVRERGPLPVDEAVNYVGQVCQALEHAAGADVVHRDIKPANLMCTPEGAIKVMDFGISKIASLTTLTHSGQSMGTPLYMAPEVAKGRPADIRSDLYSLGIVLYELLAGKVPFAADSPWAVLRQQIEDPPPPLSSVRRGLPGWVEAVVAKALAKNPAARYQTPGEMLAALRGKGREAPSAAAVGAETVIVRTTPRPVRAVTRPARGIPVAAIAGALAIVLLVIGMLAVFIPKLTSSPPLTIVHTSEPLPVVAVPTSTPAFREPAYSALTALATAGPPIETATPTTPQPAAVGAEPTSTLAPSPTRPSPTPTKQPPVTIRGTNTPPPSKLRQAVAPTLGDPNVSTQSGPVVKFQWTPNEPLQTNEGYAVLLWRDGEYRGASGLDLPAVHDACHDPVLVNYLQVNDISKVPQVKETGWYNWTVVVVNTTQPDGKGHPCTVVSNQPTPYQFTYSGGAEPPAPESPD